MAKIDSLKAGQSIALRLTEDVAAPPLHGSVASILRGTIQIEISEAASQTSAPYATGKSCILVWQEQGQGEQAPARIEARTDDALTVRPEEPMEMRKSLRVPLNAVVSYETIAPERVEQVAEEIRNMTSASSEDPANVDRLFHSGDETWEKIDEEFSRLGSQMAELNAKLDYLIALGEGRSPERSLHRNREIEDLSGTGLCFRENKPIPIGSDLRLSIELSRFPRQTVHCIGEVARSDETAPGEFQIGIHFTVINEDEREQLIHYIFRIQRRMLRNRKEKVQS